ncbi:MAG TPA: sigma-70 family RNA polymerase sigma factor [Gemmatales bacterium]|nr:sigma-70 family RNA polymerase sigma factor [Gemmatales bacterium]
MHEPMLVTDEMLIAGISRGDAASLAALYDRYAPRAFGLILQILKNQTDAEDVVQETFLQVWQQAGRYDSRKGKPTVWILLLARCRALDRLRKKQSKLFAVQENVSEPPSPAPSTDEAIQLNESQKLICSALCTLSQEQQEPIRLAFYEGLTHMEIAEQVRLPLGTVKTRIRTGMQTLRTTLTAHGEDQL